MMRTLYMTKWTLLVLVVLLPIGKVWAVCSPFAGLASINEIVDENNNKYIEVKRLSSNLTWTASNPWRVEFCLANDQCSSPLALPEATENSSPWLVQKVSKNDNPTIDLAGMDVRLIDAQGRTVDYVRVGNSTAAEDSECHIASPDLPFDNDFEPVDGNSGKYARRTPDGTGNWELAPGASEGKDTEEESNDAGVTGPTLDINNISVQQGDPATFTVSISSAGENLVFDFQTRDLSAVQGQDYEFTTGTITVPAGQTQVTIDDVPTDRTGNQSETQFFVIIENARDSSGDRYGRFDSQAGIATITPFVSRLDRFSIDVAAGASVCAPLSVKLSAYDSNDEVLTDYTGTVSLTTSSKHGRWAPGDGSGTLLPDPDDSDDGVAAYEFADADNGEVSLQLRNTHADVLTITAQDQDQAAGISVTSDPITFSENVLYIESDDDLGDDLIAGRSHDYQVSLLRRNDNDECGVASDYDETYGLKAWLTRAPEDPGGEAPALESSVSSSLSTTPSMQPESNNFAVVFAEGIGNFSLTPSDVGRYTLKLLDDTSGFVQDLNGDPLPLISASDDAPWTARPFGISIEAVDNPGAIDASGTVFRIAAGEFSLRIAGRLYESADDGNGDGAADTGANLLNNSFAPSFGREGEKVVFDHELLAPDPTNAPGQLYAPELQASDFGDGLAEKAGFRFDEVGVIEISGAIEDGNYLSAGSGRTDRIVSTSGPVGRFRPAWFDFSVDPGTFSSVPISTDRTDCTTDRDWVYTGEPFGWDVAAEITVTPKNLNGATVENYAGTQFQSLEAGNVNFGSFPVPDNGSKAVDESPLQMDAEFGTATLGSGANGSLVFTFATADEFLYPKARNARVSGYTPSPMFSLESIVDSDGVTVEVPATDLPAEFTPKADFEIRYGRITLENGFGPENTTLIIPLKAEVYGDNGFELHEDEACWFYDLAENTTLDFDNSALTPAQTKVIEVADSELILSSGEPEVSPYDYRLRLKAPAPAETEDAEQKGIYVRLGTGNSWLKDYWDAGNPSTLVNPYAWATFGVYRGNDRIIYWREIQN
jgi:MSHA biogenesis protein MshQ